MTAIIPNLDRLAGFAHAEGGWGYKPDQPTHLEPTCLALLALSLEPDRYKDLIASGCRTISACMGPDGTFRIAGGREEAVWPIALVLFVQASLGFSNEEISKTATQLMALRGNVPRDDKAAELHDIDYSIVGWPWAKGNFSWVEPTAWACLALRRAGLDQNDRVKDGLRLLLDRAAEGGGINYGNRRIFGRLTEPIPEPTALMLLALQGKSENPLVAAAANYLEHQAQDNFDLQQLCWAKLALDLHRNRLQGDCSLSWLDARIQTAHQERLTIEWLSPAPLREALTALALATDRKNVFRLPDAFEATVSIATSSAKITSPRLAERIKSRFRGLIIEGAGRLRQPLPQTAVHIAPATDYEANLVFTLKDQFQYFRNRVTLSGKRVVIKPNLVEYHRDKVINTHPNIVAAIIELCKHEQAAEIIVAEGPGHCRNVEYLVRASGLGDVLNHYKVPFVDLNHDEPVKSLNLGRLTGLEYLYLAQTVVSADVLISVPKLKTHHWAGATLSLKNLFGTLPGICYGWPKNELHWRGIDNSIVDIALTRTPDLVVVDGIIGMEGDGPLNGAPKPLGAIIMGCDPLAVDATCCRLMRLNPERMGYLVLGQKKRLGLLEEGVIEQIGSKISQIAQSFETLPQFHQLALDRSA